jgi:hypothetical protein
LQQRLSRLRSPISDKAALAASSDATALRAPAYMQHPTMPITCKPAAPVHDIEAEIESLLSADESVALRAVANALCKGKKAKPAKAVSPALAAGLTASDEALIAAFVAQDQLAVATGEAPSAPSALKGFALRRSVKPAKPAVGSAVAATLVCDKLSSVEPAVTADTAVPTVVNNSVESEADMLMFSPSLFAAVQSRLCKPCDTDACASDGGENALLPKFFSPGNSFLRADLGSTTSMLWLHPPVKGRELFLQKYAAAKALNPCLGAIILLPAKYQSSVLRSMTVLDRYNRGTSLFIDASTQTPVKAKCDFLLYVDAPQSAPKTAEPVAQLDSSTDAPHPRPTTSHVMQQLCVVAGAPAQLLIDTGAEKYNFISRRFCQRIGLSLRPCTLNVTSVHDTSGVVAGQCTAVLTMQGVKWQTKFIAIDMPEAFDVILGEDWLTHTNAQLDYSCHTCTVRKGKRMYTLQMQAPNTAAHHKQPPLAPVLSYAAAKRYMKQLGVVYCLVLAKEVKDNPAATDVNADKQTQQLQTEYPMVFTDEPPHGGSKIQLDFEVIPLPPGTNPVLRPMYRYSPLEMEEMQKQIAALLELGYITPSQSPYGAPVLFVKKPRSNELRMVIDYRAINKLSKRNAFPLPRIDDMLDHLAGATTFSLIDLRQAYHQCRLVDSDVPKTAFRTPLGHYEYVTLSFGLTNAPAAFQSVMNKLFSKHLYKFVMVYLDDILVFSKNAAEHTKHLRMVLDILRDAKLTVAIHKCKFYQEEVLFLGHIISGTGVKADPAKVQAVTDFPRPTDVPHLRSFLGMATYFRRFIDGFARVAHPLTDLLKQDTPWRWDDACEAAFCKLKELLTSAPVLALPDWRSQTPFELVCDASLKGVGGVLMQNKRPIAFESRKLIDAELRYSATELEMLAVVYCVEKWRCYIEGREVLVYTDHKPNTFFATTKMQSRRAARWLEKLQQYQLQWHYKPGPQNVVADALSRHPTDGRPIVALAVLRSVSLQRRLTDSNSFVSAIKQAYATDEYFSCRENTSAMTQVRDLWYMGDLLVVPNDEQLRLQVLAECHDTPYAGHVGRTKTLHNVRKNFWWPGVAQDVRRFVKSCDSCQRVKPNNRHPIGLLQPLPVPGDTWDSVSMDLVVSLPQTAAGFTAIAVFVDRLSKMVHLAPCRDDTTAEQFADIFVQHVFRSHGLPTQIVSDRDPRFTSKFWRALMERLGVSQAMSSAFHPQTDGNTERVNRVLEDMLRHFVDPAQSNWDALLPLVEFAINDSYHESVGNTPFVLNYGKRPRLPVDLVLGGEGVRETLKSTCDAAVNFASRIQIVVNDAKKCLIAAQQRQKAYADRYRRDIEFAVGSEVLLSTKHINIKMKGTSKLLPRWVGPFKVEKQVNAVAYKLELPASLQIHPVFHTSLLKAYEPGRVQPPPPPEVIDDEFEWQVESILAHRDVQVKKKQNRAKTPVFKRQYLVKWLGYDEAHNTWEPEDHCANSPEAVAEYWARHDQEIAFNKKKRKQPDVQRVSKRRR